MVSFVFQSLSVLRPDDPGLSEEQRWRIQAYRILSLLATALVPLFGGLYRLVNAHVVDPIWLRALFTFGFGGLLVASYVSEWVRRRYPSLLQGYLYVIMTWFAGIAALNQMSGDYALGLLFVFGALSLCFSIGVDTLRPLVGFLGYGVVLITVGHAFTPTPETSLFIQVTCAFSLAAVVYVVGRTQLSMKRSVRERALLRRHVGTHTLEMIQDSEVPEVNLSSQGQTELLAVLFTDLRGSTEQFEQASSPEFVRQLNRTFGTQAKIATHFGGSIDKFVGDAMIAIFAGEASLERALRCSIEVQRAFQLDPLPSSFWQGLGIGVNYGPMLMGNMGAEERVDYSVIGPEVNLCARLCNTAAPGQILVRKALLEQRDLTDTFRVKSVGRQTFKGFDRRFEIADVALPSDAEGPSSGA